MDHKSQPIALYTCTIHEFPHNSEQKPAIYCYNNKPNYINSLALVQKKKKKSFSPTIIIRGLYVVCRCLCRCINWTKRKKFPPYTNDY